ncbi:peptidylprolyl isomerase [Lutibacter sp.]|uniref:peptidylprolyl isomerase n=1 Tax=Lutibacter sp. TaxID=1925666 RepID=UPI00273253DB|nr:peptidylprolyl isomerase [Lutibacter sp.]MDP3313071.1 peptidylprolyl isomerase [Lutibacter sp.]
MKGIYWFFFILLFTFKNYSQEHSNVLFSIDNENYLTADFLHSYKNNLKVISESKTNSIQDYLKLFVNFKLKVKEAQAMGLDTLPKFKNELQHYKNALVLPYLKDTLIKKKLILEGYNRLQNEINASHILVTIPPNTSPKDTLIYFNKILKAKGFLLNGDNFKEVAKKYSEDPSVIENDGNLGFFTAFQMVYPFENIAYNTKINEISEPFRTRFGYHILKVHDIRKSRGEIEVNHLILSKNTQNVVRKIDSIYKLLETKKATFKEMVQKFSEDRESASNNGLMPKFGTGAIVSEFEDVAFALKMEGDISKPFETSFGWHIIQLHKKYPLESFNILYDKLGVMVDNDERATIISKSTVNKLLKKYNISINNTALQQFKNEDWKTNNAKFNNTLLSINDKKIGQQTFINYLNTVKYTSIYDAFENFKEKEVITYFKETLEFTNSEFATLYTDFKDGLLLFDLMDKLVWQKSTNLNELNAYFIKNKELKYHAKTFEEVSDQVMVDYQLSLEEILLKNLYSKYTVHINSDENSRIINFKF